MEDTNIIQLFMERSETAITTLQEKYEKLCLSIARRILPDERDAEECVSDAFLRVWNAIPPERPASLTAYLSRITRNLALDRYSYNTADRRSTALTEAFEELEAVLFSTFDVETQIQENEFRQFINQFLQAQSKENRVFFVRRYWYGESIKEIAEQFHISEEKVKSSLFRTRKQLKTALTKGGFHYE